MTGFGPHEDEDKRLFVQTLFNRLMFVYFLSRKGWLTFGGDKDYLNALWQDYQAAEGANKLLFRQAAASLLCRAEQLPV